MRSCDAAVFAEKVIDSYFEKEQLSSIKCQGVNNAHPFRIGEETLTDIMLLELAVNFPDIAQIRSFTKQAENKNGADWIWRLHTLSGKYVDMLVQAKRINESAISDPNWTINIPKKQRSKLIKTAKSHKLSPVYCFYLPGASMHVVCKELADKWRGRIYRYRSGARHYALRGSVYLVPATDNSAIKEILHIDPDQPPGISFAELMCCVYGAEDDCLGRKRSALFDRWGKYIQYSCYEGSFDEFINEIVHESSSLKVAGALELRAPQERGML